MTWHGICMGSGQFEHNVYLTEHDDIVLDCGLATQLWGLILTLSVMTFQRAKKGQGWWW